ncbi:MAG TPA: Hsp20/alpha crystallin family protein [Trueperaceae bacterium]|jgi:HSP20 family protein
MTLSTRFSRPRGLGTFAQSPFGLFSDIEQLLQPLTELGRGSIGVYHPLDLYETDDAVVLEMAVPGVSPEDLDLSLEGRQVTIRGRSAETEDEGRRYWLRGMPRGEFSRTVTVPSGIDANGIEANVEQGVLTLRMPKVPEAVARKIAVGSGRGEAVKTIETAKEPAAEAVGAAEQQPA